jgi:RHS repeat-associated protein
MHGDNGIFYLLQDHLKSSSVLVNQNGTVNSRNHFYPFGGNRGGAALSTLTTKRFTGQYHEANLPGGEGLSYYGARWYDAQVGRFLSADTIVPNPGNPQAFNRYSYVNDLLCSVQLSAPILEHRDALAHGIDERKVDGHGEQRLGFAGLNQRLAPGIQDGG